MTGYVQSSGKDPGQAMADMVLCCSLNLVQKVHSLQTLSPPIQSFITLHDSRGITNYLSIGCNFQSNA